MRRCSNAVGSLIKCFLNRIVLFGRFVCTFLFKDLVLTSVSLVYCLLEESDPLHEI